MNARINVRLTPRGGRDAVEGFTAEGVLRVRVAVAPVAGKANDAMLRLIARRLRVPHTTLRIVSGATARIKVVEVRGMDEEVLAGRFGAANG